MEINLNEISHTAQIWLTRDEGGDTALRESLKPLCAEYSQKKYRVAIFISGERDLTHQTQSLLLHNRTAKNRDRKH